jgi:hypothetical protein
MLVEALPASWGVLYGAKQKPSVETKSALRNLASATKRFVALYATWHPKRALRKHDLRENRRCDNSSLLDIGATLTDGRK